MPLDSQIPLRRPQKVIDMSKYIDAEKLKAEIERYKQEAAIARFDNAGENTDYFQGKVDLCDELTHIITSLQQEQQIGEEYAIEIGKCTHTLRVGSKSDIDNLIRQEKQEQPEVELEKTVEFECIGKKVKMTVQELINYYIDSECVEVAEECGF